MAASSKASMTAPATTSNPNVQTRRYSRRGSCSSARSIKREAISPIAWSIPGSAEITDASTVCMTIREVWTLSRSRYSGAPNSA